MHRRHLFAGLPWLVIPVSAALTHLSCSAPPGHETATSRARVEGGEVDERATQVFRVLARVTGFNELCSATLIAPQLMLTARHCVAPTPNANVNCETDHFGPTVAPSELKFSNATEPVLTSRWFSASAVVVSPESDLTCGYDIAVVVLSEPVPRSVAVPAQPRFSPLIRNGETYRAVGYGASNANEQLAEYGIRHSRDDLSVTCGQDSNCGSNMVASQEFVGDEGACHGDSGGPALDAGGQVIGVLSRGAEGCKSPVYVGVPAFESLLVRAAELANQSLGAPLPVWAGGEPEQTTDGMAAVTSDLSPTSAPDGESTSPGAESSDLGSSREDDGSASRLAPDQCSVGAFKAHPSSATWGWGWLLSSALVLAGRRRRQR